MRDLSTARRPARRPRRGVLKFAEMNTPPNSAPAACKHARTQVIAEDADAKYVECLDCGAILEADELRKETTGFNESLSDA